MKVEPLRECENCHQPILVEVEGLDPGLCPNCRPKRGRPRKASPRSERIDVRLTPSGMAYVDKARGSWSRAEYLRQAIARAAKDGLKGPR